MDTMTVLGVTAEQTREMLASAEEYVADAVQEYRATFPDVPGATALALWHVTLMGGD